MLTMNKLDLEYFEKVEANENLNKILKFSRENHIPTMLTNTGKLLYKYVKQLKPKNILEIGTAIGYSGIVMIIASENESHLTTIEKNEERVLMAKNNFKICNLYKNVEILQGDASEIVNDIKSQKYDFIFLDGSKSQYIKQIDILLDMLSIGGKIFIDDALYMYDVYKEGDVPHKHRAMIKNLRNFVVKILDNTKISKRVFNYDEGIIVVSKNDI